MYIFSVWMSDRDIFYIENKLRLQVHNCQQDLEYEPGSKLRNIVWEKWEIYFIIFNVAFCCTHSLHNLYGKNASLILKSSVCRVL